ncbi:hypothetical protein [Mycolicibacterium canariasense]|uniref:hypothetical protein n=1 Tax=Mycolicibacterium canariasense TaxID=228230 RepID=UPI0032D5A387
MNRVKAGGYAELITAAYELIPEALHCLIRPHVLCGIDPAFAGLHSFKATDDGRSYGDTWHVVYPHHQQFPAARDRRTTVVVQSVVDKAPWVRAKYGHFHQVAMMVHELGHVLDESLGFEHDASPVTKYAETNRNEAFADAFTAWLIPSYLPSYGSKASVDPGTAALFNNLVGCGQ